MQFNTKLTIKVVITSLLNQHSEIDLTTEMEKMLVVMWPDLKLKHYSIHWMEASGERE